MEETRGKLVPVRVIECCVLESHFLLPPSLLFGLLLKDWHLIGRVYLGVVQGLVGCHRSWTGVRRSRHPVEPGKGRRGKVVEEISPVARLAPAPWWPRWSREWSRRPWTWSAKTGWPIKGPRSRPISVPVEGSGSRPAVAESSLGTRSLPWPWRSKVGAWGRAWARAWARSRP